MTVVTYPQRLFSVAKDLIAGGELSIAVVVLHMAAEIAVERCLSEAFNKRGIADLEEPIGDFLNGYNLGNERICKLYVAVTSDRIQDRPFWRAFKDSAARRNKIVHQGRSIGQQEASDSLTAVGALLNHLGHKV